MVTRRQVVTGLGGALASLLLVPTARAADKGPDRVPRGAPWLPLYTPLGEVVWTLAPGQSDQPLTLWYTPPGIAGTLRFCAWVTGRGRVSLSFGETDTELDVNTATPTPIELLGQMSARTYAVPLRIFTLETSGTAPLVLTHPNLFITT